jgi:hypothetical protein
VLGHYHVPAIASPLSSVCRSGATRGEPVTKATAMRAARTGWREYSAHETGTDTAGGGDHDRRRELPAGGGACCPGARTSSPAG